jgi:uncharacterized membrane protein (UPF0127 family)
MRSFPSCFFAPLWIWIALIFSLVRVASAENVYDSASCGSVGTLQLPDGTPLKVRLALSDVDKQQGLSGRQKDSFGADDALLMVFFNYGARRVSMRDMYFDMDVFFLDRELNVLDLQRSLRSHPGRQEPPMVEKSKEVHARHVLEMRADSRYAQQITSGMSLKWTSEPSVKAIEKCMAEKWDAEHRESAGGLSLMPMR